MKNYNVIRDLQERFLICRITEVVSDHLVNLCHLMDFGSDLQLIVINLECMVSIGTSMLFVSPLTGFSVLMKF